MADPAMTSVSLTVILVVAACGGAGDCGALRASGGDLKVSVTHEDGCGGRTWLATVTFGDGRTQALAGDRDGRVTGVVIGDFSGDETVDLVVTAERQRVFGFVRHGPILFGQELPSPAREGAAAIRAGRLLVGDLAWDPASDAWIQPD
jgi:hypothetical protein